jgi:hypothetical protein
MNPSKFQTEEPLSFGFAHDITALENMNSETISTRTHQVAVQISSQTLKSVLEYGDRQELVDSNMFD